MGAEPGRPNELSPTPVERPFGRAALRRRCPRGSLKKIPSYTRSREDDPYIRAAILVGAAYMASGDDPVLEMEDPPVPVLNPAQFVSLWEAGLL